MFEREGQEAGGTSRRCYVRRRKSDERAGPEGKDTVAYSMRNSAQV